MTNCLSAKNYILTHISLYSLIQSGCFLLLGLSGLKLWSKLSQVLANCLSAFWHISVKFDSVWLFSASGVVWPETIVKCFSSNKHKLFKCIELYFHTSQYSLIQSGCSLLLELSGLKQWSKLSQVMTNCLSAKNYILTHLSSVWFTVAAILLQGLEQWSIVWT